MSDAPFLTAAEIAHKVTDGSLAALDVIETTLERIARHECLLARDPDDHLAER